MRFESVRAHAFGALSEKTLPVALGMSVIYGPNEAGKSTWHDAIYAGLCGRRRAKGARTAEERDFEERRRPWEGDRWEVSVVVVLDNGDRIEIRHDMEVVANYRATDAFGRDISSEIMNEGAPDGARLLGLDRRTFAAVACVRQAQILAVQQNAGLLQEYLQRAAATAGGDETAAAALRRIADYRKEHVGQDRIGAKKPLRLAHERVGAAEAALGKARQAHASFLELSTRADEARRRAERALGRLRSLRAAAAAGEAEGAGRRLARAGELKARFASGPPQAPTAQDVLVQAASAALAGWKSRPDVCRLEGRSAAELKAELDSLPWPPRGDASVDPAVERAASAFMSARQRVELHLEERPEERPAPRTGGVPAEQLIELARDLVEPSVPVDPALEEQLCESRRRRASLDWRRAAGLAAGAIVTIIGLVVVLAGRPVAGLAAGVVGVFVVLWSALRLRAARRCLEEEIARLEGELVGARHAARRVEERRGEARRQVQALGLPADPQELRALAGAAAGAEESSRRFMAWEKRHAELCESAAGAERLLREALRARSVALDGDTREALEGYRRACAERAVIAAKAARRGDLERALVDREAAERAAANAIERRSAAYDELRRAAAACDVEDDDGEALAAGLRDWLASHQKALEAYQAAAREYGELQNLLEGGTVGDRQAAVQRLKERAEQLRLEAGEDVEAAAPGDDPVAELAGAGKAFENASKEADTLAGQVKEREASLPGVAEAEEELDSARRELDRVEGLERTLSLAEKFLESAQSRVHRNIAPRLVASVQRWLPQVTCGRYQRVTVDPATLEVRVCGSDGQLRRALHLSHGTAEQVYLLLRVALAEHLTKPGERCPLVLDEVTVQSDADRTRALLELLHEMSRDRQVILFSQEPQVRDWARQRLDPPRDRLEELS